MKRLFYDFDAPRLCIQKSLTQGWVDDGWKSRDGKRVSPYSEPSYLNCQYYIIPNDASFEGR